MLTAFEVLPFSSFTEVIYCGPAAVDTAAEERDAADTAAAMSTGMNLFLAFIRFSQKFSASSFFYFYRTDL